jgi:hypothetical protein
MEEGDPMKNEQSTNAKRAQKTQRKFTARHRCVERVIEHGLNPAAAYVWQELLDGLRASYGHGCPITDLVARFERIAKDGARVEPDQTRVDFVRTMRETAGLGRFVRYHLDMLASEGLVKLGARRYIPWVWPLPVEAWPEESFLAALGLRLA